MILQKIFFSNFGQVFNIQFISYIKELMQRMENNSCKGIIFL